MISYQEALAHFEKIAPHSLQKETAKLSDALGKILAEDVTAPFSWPRFTNSAMDGYAFHHARINSHLPMQVVDTIHAGETVRATPTNANQICVRIMTGAPVPAWADTVVPIEKTTPSGAASIVLQGQIKAGANVRVEGSDIRNGQTLLRAGKLLGPEDIMICANFGIVKVPVKSPPNIFVACTGDELTEPGEKLSAAGVYNSSKYFLQAAIEKLCGAGPAQAKTFTDQPEIMASELEKTISERDGGLIITTGAVSAGVKDFIPQMVASLGFHQQFHKVAIRPGKPIFYATAGNWHWLGLPGNPLSTAVGWHFFVRPFLAKWAGFPLPEVSKASIMKAIVKPEGLRSFLRGHLRDEQIEIFPEQGSCEFSASLEANAYAIISEDCSTLDAGSSINVQRL